MKQVFFCLALFLSFTATAQQLQPKTDGGELRCQSLTKAGTQCSKTATMPDNRCKIHSAETPRCTATTKAGKPCTRAAGKGKSVCWQHDPEHTTAKQ